MNRELSFVTGLFENKQVEPHFINDRCFGEDLARWLAAALTAGEFDCGEPYQEDWGWEVPARRGEEKFFIQIGIVDDTIGADEAEWLISVESARSWFVFGKRDPAAFSALCGEIERALRAAAGIREIGWRD